jgi:DNA-binding XRE family transcriptional regulator
MDLEKNGKLLCNLRKAKGLTQKQVADKLGILPKTVSKWETGRGFPDVSTLSALADILGVSEKALLSGDLAPNSAQSGNIKRTKFYVCPSCRSFAQCMGNSQVVCCGKQLMPLEAQPSGSEHSLTISEVEGDFCIEIAHEMTKAHYISFLSYVSYDRVLTIKLYPEQDCFVRFPKIYGGKFYYYCTKHGLFEYKM